MKKNKPQIYGTGLICLDIVISLKNKELAFPGVGGTCGNVLTILSYLGWEALPVSRLDNSLSSDTAKNDMIRWGVNLDYASIEQTKPVPIIMQVNKIGNNGIPQHKFIWNCCPKCGSWLPRYIPITVKNVNSIKEKIKGGTVYFFDRTSPGALELARHFKQLGSIIFFEPSAKGVGNEIEQAIKLSDIVKYSDQRNTKELTYSLKKHKPFLVIETMGELGLKYQHQGNKKWKYILPYKPKTLIDTSGCGDWTTAGIIFKLCSDGREKLLKQKPKSIEVALKYGQALGAWNCEFQGARYGMYVNSKRTFQKQIDSILKSENLEYQITNSEKKIFRVVSKFCPNCS